MYDKDNLELISLQPLFKLHGSTNWDDSEGEVFMVNPCVVDWAGAPAVYVIPTETVAEEMADAVGVFQIIGGKACSLTEDLAWICSAEGLRYYQAISGRGLPLKHGLACSTQWEIPDQKFYSESMVIDLNQCVALYWDDKDASYVIEDSNDRFWPKAAIRLHVYSTAACDPKRTLVTLIVLL